MGKKPGVIARTALLRARDLLVRARDLVVRSIKILARTSRSMRYGAVVLLVVFIGLAVVVNADLLPQRNIDLYPLRWQNATSLPAYVVSFAFAASAPNVGYACTTSLRSQPTPPRLPSASSITPIASPEPPVTPTATRTPGPTPAIVSFSAVFRTQDGGMTWRGMQTPFAAERICRVFVAPLDANQVFIAQSADLADGSTLPQILWCSTDGGETWRPLGTLVASGDHAEVTALVAVGSRIVAEVTSFDAPSTSSQLYRSDDDGKTWQPLESKVALTGLFAAGRTLYARADSTTTSSSAITTVPLYGSTDLGDTWTPIAPPFANVSGLTFLRAADGASTYGVGLIPASTAYGAQAHAVIVSKDGGATWSTVDAPPTLGVLSVQMLPDGTLLIESRLDATPPAGPSAEIFRMRPGETAWQLIGIGPYVDEWQIARASGDAGAATRLWAYAPGPSVSMGYVWADLP